MQLQFTDHVHPGELFHLARVAYQKPGHRLLHTHDFCELFFIEAGRGMHLINGQRQRIQAGDAVAIRPDDEHEFRVTDKTGFVMLNLAFDQSHLQRLRDQYFGNRDDWPWHGNDLPASWRLAPLDLQRLIARLDQMPNHRHQLLALDLLLLEALDTAVHHASEGMTNAPAWLTNAIEQARTMPTMPSRVSEFVDLTGKSNEHVTRTVRQTHGCTTTRLLNDLRLQRAGAMLRMSDRPIIDIAYDCGFGNLGHFYNKFRQRFETTPRRYRLDSRALA